MIVDRGALRCRLGFLMVSRFHQEIGIGAAWNLVAPELRLDWDSLPLSRDIAGNSHSYLRRRSRRCVFLTARSK
jgi:hypothetical protein